MHEHCEVQRCNLMHHNTSRAVRVQIRSRAGHALEQGRIWKRLKGTRHNALVMINTQSPLEGFWVIRRSDRQSTGVTSSSLGLSPRPDSGSKMQRRGNGTFSPSTASPRESSVCDLMKVRACFCTASAPRIDIWSANWPKEKSLCRCNRQNAVSRGKDGWRPVPKCSRRSRTICAAVGRSPG
jgi:hypothetical protein